MPGMEGQRIVIDGDFAREIDPNELQAFECAGMVNERPMRAVSRARPSLAIPPRPPADLAPPVRKGRGTTINPPNRFIPTEIAPFDDGWRTLEVDFSDLPPLPTTSGRRPRGCVAPQG